MEQSNTPLLDVVWGEMMGRLAVPLLIAVVVLLVGIIMLMKTRSKIVFGGLLVVSLLLPVISFVSFIGLEQNIRNAAKDIPSVKPQRVEKVIDMASHQPYYGLIASLPAIVVAGIGLSRKPRRDRD